MHGQVREHAHRLIEFVSEDRVTALVSLLEAELTPLQRALVDVPLDDEPAKAVPFEAATVAHDDVLVDLGLTSDDFERMAETPLPSLAR